MYLNYLELLKSWLTFIRNYSVLGDDYLLFSCVFTLIEINIIVLMQETIFEI